MPKLENAKHDEFARLLAQGVKQGEAYVKAGYSENKGAASRLATSPKIQDRVAEYKKEIEAKIETAMAVPTKENWRSLSEMGIDYEWVAEQYRLIYEQSIAAGSFPSANTAVQNIQKLLEMEDKRREDVEEEEGDKISVKDTLALLQGMKEIMTAPEPTPAMRDITPEDAE